MIYLFVEGVLDVRQLKIDTPLLKVGNEKAGQKGISSGTGAGDP